MVSLSSVSCIEEATPSDGVTAEQLEGASLLGMSNAIAAYMNTVSASSSDYTAIGYPGIMLWREVMAGDWSPVSTDYDYFTYYASGQYIGDYYLQGKFWQFYYYLIQKCNLLIGMDNAAQPENRPYLGNALVYRAMAYMDMMRWYEFRPTGIAELDAKAQENGCLGLTVPITTEKTTEAESRHNPRAPFYEMYRFILTDLHKAEQNLSNLSVARVKSEASIAVCHGMMARFWLEAATRFRFCPEDLELQLQHENDVRLSALDMMGVNTLEDCYAKADLYAQKAISESGCRPLTENEWFNPRTGFNTDNDAWMWAILMAANDAAVTEYSWDSWVSFTSPEAEFGVASTQYRCSRMIDAALFASIPSTDWRRWTWIDPDHFNEVSPMAEENFKQRYQQQHNVTQLGYQEWKKLAPYVGMKFHPGQGNRTTYKTGNQVDVPLMRIEEMYLISAEALAYQQGIPTGVDALKQFVSTYRDPDYNPQISTSQDFDAEILRQRRLEFWGEGVTMFDYKRLQQAVTRGYAGTNHPAAYRLNSLPGYCAPWMNVYITSGEYTSNESIVLNPNPSGLIQTWEE